MAFSFGTLVSFRAELTTGAWVSVFGRVAGRLTPNSSFVFGGMNRYMYLVETFVDLTDDAATRIDWGLWGDHVEVMSKVSDKTLLLDWGELPPLDTRHVWTTIDSGELSTIVRNADRDKFKNGGVCPECGDRGEWVMCGLFCRFHGKFAG